jgi:hypothetical protein
MSSSAATHMIPCFTLYTASHDTLLYIIHRFVYIASVHCFVDMRLPSYDNCLKCAACIYACMHVCVCVYIYIILKKKTEHLYACMCTYVHIFPPSRDISSGYTNVYEHTYKYMYTHMITDVRTECGYRDMLVPIIAYIYV